MWKEDIDVAKGPRVSNEIGQAQLRLEGRQWIVPVVFEEPDATPVIAATALETFGLGVDPDRGVLAPVTTYQVGGV
jgi:hypothetical protein